MAPLGWTAAALWASAWLNPDHTPPWIPFLNEAAMALALVVAVLATLLDGRWSADGSALHLLRRQAVAASIGAVIAAQWCVGAVSREAAVLYGLTVLAWVLAHELGRHADLAVTTGRANSSETGLRAHEPLESRALLLMAGTALLSAATVLVQVAGVRDAYPDWVAAVGPYRPFGNLGQPNNEATFLAMGLVAWEILAQRGVVRRAVQLAAVALVIVALVATGSRAGLIGALLSGAWLARRPGGGAYRAPLAWMLGLLLASVCYALWGGAVADDKARSLAEATHDPVRLLLYRSLLDAVAAHPWLGVGVGNTGQAQAEQALAVPVGAAVSYAHHLPLDLLLWFGLPLGLALMAWVAWRVRVASQTLPPARRRLLVLLVPVGFHALVEQPYAYAFFLITTAAIWGYVTAPVDPAQNSPNGATGGTTTQGMPAPLQGWTARHMVLCLTTVYVLVGAAVIWEYLQLTEDFSVARFEMRHVGSRPVGYERPRALLLDDLAGQIEALRIDALQDLSPSQLRLLQRQAWNNHVPVAHVKLVQYALMHEDFATAHQEILRLGHLYGANDSDTLIWAGVDLRSIFCGHGPQARPDRCEPVRDLWLRPVR